MRVESAARRDASPRCWWPLARNAMFPTTLAGDLVSTTEDLESAADNRARTREPLGQTRPPWPNENLPLFEWRAVVARHGSTAPSRRFDSRQEHRRIVHARLATDTTENRRRLKSTIATSPSNGHSLPSAPRVASAGLRGTRPSPRLPTLAPLTIAWRDRPIRNRPAPQSRRR